MSDAPREYSTEEIRDKFIDYMRTMVDYWARESRTPDAKGKLEGLAHSILAALDGCAAALPAWILAPCPHPDDREFHEKEGENWYPENHKLEGEIRGQIAGSLHDMLFKGWRT